MNMEALFLFLILLLGLVLCSFLGGNCSKEGLTNNGVVYNGPNGDTAVLITNSDGTQTINLNQTSGSSLVIFTQSASSPTLFTNPFGFTATVSNNTIVFAGPSGQTITFTISTKSVSTNSSQNSCQNSSQNSSQNSYDNYNHYDKTSTSSPTYSPDSITSTQYYGSTGNPIPPPSGSSLAYTGPYGGTVGAVTGPQGNTVAGTSSSNNSYQGPYGNEYSSTLPPGVSRSQIPPGQEDLYILKSEIVPPVCPACPSAGSCPRQEPCPPCPSCARCPEPPITCKAVPNYNAIDEQYLPQPVLNDFSTFGM